MMKPLKRSLFAIAAAATLVSAAHAAAPMVKTPAPGFFRMMVGDFEVTPINDGTVDLPVDQLLRQKAELTRATLEKNHLKLPLETSDNAFLINTGSKLVLVDTGAGALFGPTLGKFVQNLKAAGYQPEQIDEIYITHMHGDHVGGLVHDGKRVFPNAVVRAGKATPTSG
jgi:glyoxylase-like metal-dependent hydrolase (beta-lactamase superfamily II)